MTTETILSTTMSATELSSILLKASMISSSDAGFCSGSSENGEDMLSDHPRSPTEASDDSIEMKVTPIVLPLKHKRKSSEPFKLIKSDIDVVPLKKRKRYDVKLDTPAVTDKQTIKKEDCQLSNDSSGNHFRPWIAPIEDSCEYDAGEPEAINPAEELTRHPGVTTLHRLPPSQTCEQDQPLSLVAKKSSSSSPPPPSSSIHHQNSSSPLQMMSNSMHHHPQAHSPLTGSKLDLSSSSDDSPQPGPSRPLSQHRNYKNMTRERRIEANARERTRVHTISAAFDTLRKSIPSYSNNQKLSKLSILRVSCQYILLLSRVAGMDYSEDGSEPSLSDCVDQLTRTIQTEGKLRKKKDE